MQLTINASRLLNPERRGPEKGWELSSQYRGRREGEGMGSAPWAVRLWGGKADPPGHHCSCILLSACCPSVPHH